MKKSEIRPNRNEIWWVNLDPTIGEELKKLRPVLVVNLNLSRAGREGMKIVVPLCSWKSHYESIPWMIEFKKSKFTFLKEDMAADPSQIRAVSVERFKSYMGRSSGKIIEEITSGVALIIGFA